jgi:putative FmdB family regulatory protein
VQTASVLPQGFQPEAGRASYNFLFRIKSPDMPIYAYRCAACGHSRDVLQKISDPVLTACPVCGADQFQKQVTAAGFQLKGSGWYATDFKGGASTGAPAVAPSGDGGASAPAAAPAPSSDGGGSSSGSDGGSSSGGSASASASSSGSHGGGSCACH